MANTVANAGPGGNVSNPAGNPRRSSIHRTLEQPYDNRRESRSNPAVP